MTSPIQGVPSSNEVARIHTKADTDSSVTSAHHTLGIQHNQASPGDHKHDGKTSKKLGKGFNSSFPTAASATYSQSQIQAIIDALRNLGYGS